MKNEITIKECIMEEESDYSIRRIINQLKNNKNYDKFNEGNKVDLKRFFHLLKRKDKYYVK